MSFEKILTKKIIKIIWIFIGAVVVLYGFFKFVIERNILSLKIPDVILLAAIVFIFIVDLAIISAFKEHQNLPANEGSEGKIKELSAELGKLKSEIADLKADIKKNALKKVPEEVEEVSLETIFVLYLLAQGDQPKEGIITNFYKEFKRDGTIEVSIILADLETKGYVSSYDDSWDTAFWTNTNRGLLFLGRHRDEQRKFMGGK